MRSYEISNGYSMLANNEEQKLIDLIDGKGELAKSDLDPRQQELAHKLVSRGILGRHKNKDGKNVLTHDRQSANLWRI